MFGFKKKNKDRTFSDVEYENGVLSLVDGNNVKYRIHNVDIDSLSKYKTMHEQLAQDFVDLQSKYDKVVDDTLSYRQQLERIDAQNALLGNAMFEVVAMTETKAPNGTTKKIKNYCNDVINSLK